MLLCGDCSIEREGNCFVTYIFVTLACLDEIYCAGEIIRSKRWTALRGRENVCLPLSKRRLTPSFSFFILNV